MYFVISKVKRGQNEIRKLHCQRIEITDNESWEAAKPGYYIKLLNEDQMSQWIKQTDDIFIIPLLRAAIFQPNFKSAD